MEPEDNYLESQALAEQDHPWQRVAKLAIVELLFKFLWRLLKENWALFAPVAIYIGTFQENSLMLLGFGLLLVLSGVILYAIFYYLSFGYYLDPERKVFLLKRGVFVNDRITLAFSRVQNVNQSQPFYFRPFKLVNLALDSAGSSAKEITIPGVRVSQAQSIRETLQDFKQEQNQDQTEERFASEASSSEHSEPDGELENSSKIALGLKELIQFGLSNQSVLMYVLVGLGPTLRAFDIKMGDLFKEFVAWLSTLSANPGIHADSVTLKIVFILLLLLVCQLGVVIYSVLRHWGYQLKTQGDSLEKISGLTDTQQVSVKKRKVQALLFYQNIVARLLGFYRVRFLQISQGFGDEQKNHFILPFLKRKEWRKFTHNVFGKDLTRKGDSARPKPQLLIRYFIFFVLLPGLYILGLAYWHGQAKLLFLFLLLGLTTALLYRRYRLFLVRRVGEYTLVRSAWLGEQRYIFLNCKIQSLAIRQSFWQRRAGLCDLIIYLSSRRLAIPYLPQAWAARFVDELLMIIEAKNESWH